MNSEDLTPSSPREELEAQITALLLGELSETEAAALREKIAADPELVQLHTRLGLTMGLVKEALASPEPVEMTAPEGLKLSEERREKLLESFKVTAPVEFKRTAIDFRSWSGLAAMIAFLLVAAKLLFPKFAVTNPMTSMLALGPDLGERGQFDRSTTPLTDEQRLEPAAQRSLAALREKVAAIAAPAVTAEKLVESRGGRQRVTVLKDDGVNIDSFQAASTADGRKLNETLETQLGQKVKIELPGGGEDLFAARGEVALAPFGSSAVSQQPTALYSVDAGAVAYQPADTSMAVEGNVGTRGQAPELGRLFRFGGGGGQTQNFDVDTVAAATFERSSRSKELGDMVASSGGAQRGFYFDAEAPKSQLSLGFAVDNSRSISDPEWVGVLERPATPPTTTSETLNRFVGRFDSSGVTEPEITRSMTAPVQAGGAGAAGEADFVAVPGMPGGMGGARMGGENKPASGPSVVGRDLATVDSLGRGLGVEDEAAREAVRRSPTVAGRPLDRAARPALDEVADQPGQTQFRSSVLQKNESDAKKVAESAGDKFSQVTDGLAVANGTVAEKEKRAESPPMSVQGGTLSFNPATGLPVFGEPVAPPSLYGSLPSREGNRQSSSSQLAPALISQTPEMARSRVATSQQVQDARLLIENGRLDEAEKKLKETVQIDPDHRAASYYLNLVKEQKYSQEARKREVSAEDRVVNIEKSWNAQPQESRVAQLTRDLETQQTLRETFAARIEEEKAAKSPAIKMIDRAEANSGKAPSILERFRGSERVARLEIPKTSKGTSPTDSNTRGASYDPFFVQTELEIAKSQDVLNEVAEKLNLGAAWADQKGNGTKLPLAKTTEILKQMVDVRAPKVGEMDIAVRSSKPEEAALIANTIAEVYQKKHQQVHQAVGAGALQQELAKQDEKLVKAKQELEALKQEVKGEVSQAKPVSVAGVPQPEVSTAVNAFSTFSLNVSDVSFKLAAASLEKGMMPEPATVRSEEFINAFDYRDPAAVGSARVGFAWERARYPFAHDRDLLRFSVKTAASGREAGRPLNLVLLLDNSGSMERADRVRIIQECLRILTGQLQAQDKISVVTFARTARLQVDGLAGNAAGDLPARVGEFTPEGGTNLEEAMRVAYETAAKHFQTNGVNRVVLLTDGAANLGEVKAESLKQKVEGKRKEGIALDCFGIGWEGLNDDLLEQLSRNGDGRYGFVNSAEAASAEFAGQLAGALKVAASDVKVQVEFNPKRTTTYRQIGYAKHQLTKEQFRDNTVDAAEIGAAEAGNALYVAQVNPAGEGPIATVRARFKVPGTNDYREHEWDVPYEGASKGLEQSSPAMRLAGASSAFSEWLVASPYAGEVTPDRLLGLMGNVPESFANDGRPKQLEWMIRQAKSVAGK